MMAQRGDGQRSKMGKWQVQVARSGAKLRQRPKGIYYLWYFTLCCRVVAPVCMVESIMDSLKFFTNLWSLIQIARDTKEWTNQEDSACLLVLGDV